MRRCQANLPNRCRRQIDRVAHRAFEGWQAVNRECRAATTGNTYCGNLLWQSGLTLSAPDFDDIGNRESSSERGTNAVYAANQLNQYSAVDDFTPQFDDDGNQTLIKTSTGIWQVQYNGENRPIYWSNGTTNIVMSFDCMGRRVTKDAQRFIYDGYLQIADNNGNAYVWDPTEPVATRPLVWIRGTFAEYYTHDGNKNMSEVVLSNGVTEAHYEWAPFGVLVAHSGDSAMENHWRYSSEYADDMLGLVYYNYRHYESVMGRWLSRDTINERGGKNLYVFCSNSPTRSYDAFGETDVTSDTPFPGAHQVGNKWWLYVDDGQNGTVTLIRKDLSYLIEQMEIAAKRLCRYARDEGERSRDHEGYFDTDFFAGEGVQHQYYLIEGQSRIWADNEVNYIGIGMYEAWIGDNIISAHAIVYAYKAFKWHTLPTEGTFHWLDIGYGLFDSFYSGLDPCTCEYKKDGADSGRPDNRGEPGRPGNRGVR